MENMAIQDIQNGNGIAYVDPHGEGAEKLLDFIPKERIKDVIFFNPADLDFPIAFNVMEKVDFRYRHLVAGGLMAVFKKVWPDVWSARMEYILSNTILALLEYPDSTLLGVNRMLSDVDYRGKVVAQVKDPIVKAFWSVEYARYSQKYEIEATAAIQNKVGQFVSNALIRNVIGQVKSTVNMRKIMDEGKILILDLSKGRIGEDNSRLLGALLITKIQLAAMSRVDIPEPERRDFYLYVDEFQNFATESFASILSEARKYRLNLIVGHQYITQMDEIVRDAVFGNVGTMAVFRVGAEDAEFLEREFSPEFTAEDLVNLSKYNIYLKLMIDGVASHPFSAGTLPPPAPLAESNRDAIIEASRAHYGVPKVKVEEDISFWTANPLPNEPGGVIIPAGDKRKTPIGVTPPNSAPPAPPKMSTGTLQADGVTTLYDAVCANCGKSTKVIFEPKEGKPVYCKSCLKKMKADKTENPKSEIPNPKQIPNPKLEIPKPEIPKPQIPAQPPVASPPAPAPKVEVKVTVKQEPVRVENRSFNHSPRNAAPVAPKPAGSRKEINLSELKKMIDKSLEHDRELKKQHEEKEVEVEINEDEMPQPPTVDDSSKKIINPGQKIDL